MTEKGILNIIEVTFGEPILPPWDADPEKVTQILQESVEDISN